MESADFIPDKLFLFTFHRSNRMLGFLFVSGYQNFFFIGPAADAILDGGGRGRFENLIFPFITGRKAITSGYWPPFTCPFCSIKVKNEADISRMDTWMFC